LDFFEDIDSENKIRDLIESGEYSTKEIKKIMGIFEN
jgi:bacterioferritin-associated ferredoxin